MILEARALEPLGHRCATRFAVLFWLHSGNRIAKDHEAAVPLPVPDEWSFEAIARFRETERRGSVLRLSRERRSNR